jgi:hypothetical protein
MARGRPKEIIQEPKPIKYTNVYEDDEIIETWKFDLKKFERGPIEIDIKYKPGAEKAIKSRIKENKRQKQVERQMKKINNKFYGKKIR